MKTMARLVLVAVWAALSVGQAYAQTADEVIEKHLAAMGGRSALTKLQSRVTTGTVTIATQGVELSGSLEIYLKAPNKSRSVIKLDLTTLGGGVMIIDQRCDGQTAYAINSMQGDREITGNPLENMLNATFPTPLLRYKEAGIKAELVGKDKVGSRDAYVLLVTPKAGSASRQFYDAESYLLLRVVMRINTPELGGEIEQTSDMSDYRDVDGVKVPFQVSVVNPIQTVTMKLTTVENNKPLDDAMFARPSAK